MARYMSVDMSVCLSVTIYCCIQVFRQVRLERQCNVDNTTVDLGPHFRNFLSFFS